MDSSQVDGGSYKKVHIKKVAVYIKLQEVKEKKMKDGGKGGHFRSSKRGRLDV